jgi:hypothetical protein
MMFDESTAVQMKMLRMIMLCDNLCTRTGYGQDLSPSEALAYKQLLDFTRQHARIMELHLREGIDELEKEWEAKHGDDNFLPEPEREGRRNKPPGRVVDGPYRPPDQGLGESEEGDGLGPLAPN